MDVRLFSGLSSPLMCMPCHHPTLSSMCFHLFITIIIINLITAINVTGRGVTSHLYSFSQEKRTITDVYYIRTCMPKYIQGYD